ncbi:MAG: sugar phosphate isomerase/epimerase [Zavarzinella sp.]
MDRRQVLLSGAAGIAAGSFVSPLIAAPEVGKKPFEFCLNTSTIRGQKIPVEQEAEMAAKAGYQGFEPWIRELQTHQQQGKSLKDLGKKLADLGLKVESAIGFAKWIVDDDMERTKGLDEAKRDMEMVLTIGGKRIAAPPIGATNQKMTDFGKITQRYRTLADLGSKIGIIPELELWGFSKTLSRLGETVLVAMESAHPQACILPDVYHLYKGESGFSGLNWLQGQAIGIFHMNDYPKSKPPATIVDADRVYPGDGDAPLVEILRQLRRIGYQGMLSLELFNPEYYKQDAYTVVKTGLEKMQQVVKNAMQW